MFLLKITHVGATGVVKQNMFLFKIKHVGATGVVQICKLKNFKENTLRHYKAFSTQVTS